MRILVFGNINAGKSTIVSELLKVIPETPVLSIDNYRRQHGDGTHGGDVLAMDQFVRHVAESCDAIVECTGLGPLGHKLHDTLPAKEALVLHVVAPLEECLARIAKKDFALTPYPPFSEILPDTIRRCHNEFERGDLRALWDDVALWIFAINGTVSDLRSEIKLLPIRQLLALSAVVRAARAIGTIRSLVWYGSGARGELTPESDIDLFAVTDLSVDRISCLLAAAIPEVVFQDHVGTKATLRFVDRTLVEIDCSNDLSRINTFYAEARVQDHARTVLIGDDDVREHLCGLASRRVDQTPLIKSLLSECVYFVLSLPPIARKGDRYKFYFHNNIVVHNVIRLKALATGDDFLNFLPPNALCFLEPDEVGVLLYNLGDDMIAHARRLRRYLRRFIETLRLCWPPGIEQSKYLSYLKRFDGTAGVAYGLSIYPVKLDC